jgi:hypothetical protein
MSYKFHAWISLILIAALFAISIASLITSSIIIIAGYLLITLAGGMLVAYSFCAKCPIRLTGCRHIIIGPLTRIFPKRKEAPYTAVDIFFTTIAIIAIVGFPQVSLISKMPLFISYWLTAIVLVVEIVLFICRGCGNVYCPVRNATKMSPNHR